MDPKLYKGSIETIVIKLLNDHKEMYGYEICQRIKEVSQEEILLKEGSLYPLLHRMEGKGILVAESRPYGNRLRKYYSLSPEGNAMAKSYIDDMQAYLRMMASILHPINDPS